MNDPHPWGVFLKARTKCIIYFKRQGKSDKQIAIDLSMDEEQVQRIREYAEELKRKEMGNE